MEQFRHAIQHLDNRLTGLAESGDAAWGTISWIALTYGNEVTSGQETDQILIAKYGVMVSGSTRREKVWEFSVPSFGQPFKNPVNSIILSMGDLRLSLDDMLESVSRFWQSLENFIVEKYPDLPEWNSESLSEDLYIIGDIFAKRV